MQMLVMGRARHALLAEPAISMALQKTASFPLKVVAPKLYRSADLQKEWASTFKTSARIPQAGIAALGKLDKTVLKRFQEEYTKALKWYIKNPKKAGKETAETLPMLDAKALANSIKYITLDSVVAGRCQKQLESFFRVLLKSEPKVVGGKLPDKGFYYR
jgi:NitT/TauT family transport system substrate-binding protein